MHLSGLKMRSRSGTRIGGRMGRPGKSKPRKMNPPPHVLFPLGDSGGARRSFQSASAHTEETDQNNTEIDFQKEGGIIEIEVGRRRCSQCGEIGYLYRCEKCGGHTVRSSPARNAAGKQRFPAVPAVTLPATCSQRMTLDVKGEYAKVMARLGLKTDSSRAGQRCQGGDLEGEDGRGDGKRHPAGDPEHLGLQGRDHAV